MSALRIVVAVLLLGLLACSDAVVTDPGGLKPPEGGPLPLVADGDAGRDQAIANLEIGYEEMRLAVYERLVHPDFVFRVDPADAGTLGMTELSGTEDLESTRRMFDGETGLQPDVDESGRPTGAMVSVPSVKAIRLTLAGASASAWTLMTQDEFAQTWRRIYDFDMTVTYAGGTRIDFIRGKQVFYLAAANVEVDGELQEIWQLRGWEDQGVDSRIVAGAAGRDSAPTSLSAFKAWFLNASEESAALAHPAGR